jgi:hypothetical protein
MSVDDVRLHSMHLSLGYHGFVGGVGVGIGIEMGGCIRFLVRRRRLDRPKTNGFNLKRGRVGLLTHRGWVLHIRRLRLLGFRFVIKQKHHHLQETQLRVVADDDDAQHQHISELTRFSLPILFFRTSVLLPSVRCPCRRPVGARIRIALRGHRSRSWLSRGDYNVPFLDLHHYYAGGGAARLSLRESSWADEPLFPPGSFAFAIIRTAGNATNPNLAPGALVRFDRTPSPSGTIRHYNNVGTVVGRDI